jgi:morphogenetic protein associated with SpoVID
VVTVSPPATGSPSPGPTPSPAPTPPTAPPGGTPLPTPHVYIVHSGDTLWQIAQTFGVALDQLISANPQIKDPSVILPGEQVTIPTPTPAP